MKRSRYFHRPIIINEISHLVGFIDFMGIFHWDPDPYEAHGYIYESVSQQNMLLNLMNINYLKKWEDSIEFSYDFLKNIISECCW